MSKVINLSQNVGIKHAAFSGKVGRNNSREYVSDESKHVEDNDQNKRFNKIQYQSLVEKQKIELSYLIQRIPECIYSLETAIDQAKKSEEGNTSCLKESLAVVRRLEVVQDKQDGQIQRLNQLGQKLVQISELNRVNQTVAKQEQLLEETIQNLTLLQEERQLLVNPSLSSTLKKSNLPNDSSLSSPPLKI